MNARKWDCDYSISINKLKEQNTDPSKDFKKNFKDERLYMPQLKDGKAQAEIRFLPQKDPKAIPIVKTYHHAFSGPGGWFINECPWTIRQKCPACEAIQPMWDSDKKLAVRRAKKTSYYANILVVKDPQNRENEGKVFLFKFGKTIYDKIMNKCSPTEGGIDEPIVVFSWYEGANFKLKIESAKSVDQYTGKERVFPNYDLSEWATPSAFSDEEIEKIRDKLYDLDEYYDPKRFKSYEQLKERYLKVVGEVVDTTSEAPETSESSSVSQGDSKIIDNPKAEEDFWNKVAPQGQQSTSQT